MTSTNALVGTATDHARIALGSDGTPWVVVTLPGRNTSDSPAARLRAALAELRRNDHAAHAVQAGNTKSSSRKPPTIKP